MSEIISLNIKEAISLARNLKVLEHQNLMDNAIAKLEYWESVFDYHCEMGDGSETRVRSPSIALSGLSVSPLKSPVLGRERGQSVGVRARGVVRNVVADMVEITEEAHVVEDLNVDVEVVEKELNTSLKVYINNISCIDIDMNEEKDLENVFDEAFELFGLEGAKKDLYDISLWFENKTHIPITNIFEVWNEYKDNEKYKFHLHRRVDDIEKNLSENQLGPNMEDFIPNEDKRKSFLNITFQKAIPSDPMDLINELNVRITRRVSNFNHEDVEKIAEDMSKKKKEKKGFFNTFKSSKRSSKPKVKKSKTQSKDIFKEIQELKEIMGSLNRDREMKLLNTEEAPKRISKSEETISEHEESNSWISPSMRNPSKSAITLSSRLNSGAKSISNHN